MEYLYVLIAAAMGGVFFIILLMIILQAKTQNKVLTQKKMIAENEILHQRELARILITSQEEEQRRIGMDLHDDVGTALSALRILLEKIAPGVEDEQLAALKTAGKRSIDGIITNVRKISHNLSPFMKGGYELKDGLEDRAEQLSRANDLKVFLHFNGIEQFRFLADEAQLSVYRILSELMNNTIKHANAAAINISFVLLDMQLTISYQDDGIGMPYTATDKKGIGMANIESRCNALNASYTIAESRKNGFAMELKIPVKQ